MANKAIQAGNTIITFDDATYSATPQSGGGNVDLIIKKGSNLICTIYNNAIIYWDVPPTLASITTKGQHAVVTLT